MAIRETTGNSGKRGKSSEPPRWLLLLLAVLAALVVGLSAGILAAASGNSAVEAVWAGAVAFGAALALMITVISFLASGRSR